MATTLVTHLVRYRNGIEPFRTFLDSYRRHSAGAPHELLLCFKGFRRPTQTRDYERLAAGIAYRTWQVHDHQFDLTVYRVVAQTMESEYCCFLNSFSQLLADDWLSHLLRQVGRPDVGLVAATGSHESLRDCIIVPRPRKHPKWLQVFRNQWRREHRAERFHRSFPPYPNPHLRTNAFVVRRALFVSLRTGSLGTKLDCLRFESGKASLTRQVQRRGLKTLVVGRDGLGYEPAEWFASRTFRSGNQENLLVADNQTEYYQHAESSLRQDLAGRAWPAPLDADPDNGDWPRLRSA